MLENTHAIFKERQKVDKILVEGGISLIYNGGCFHYCDRGRNDSCSVSVAGNSCCVPWRFCLCYLSGKEIIVQDDKDSSRRNVHPGYYHLRMICVKRTCNQSTRQYIVPVCVSSD